MGALEIILLVFLLLMAMGVIGNMADILRYVRASNVRGGSRTALSQHH
jgi:hypothetical protein